MRALLFLGLVALSAPALAADQFKPDMTAVENSVRNRLRDPESARFTWPHPFIRDQWDMANGKHFAGWITCGTVNSKNGYGGYAGAVATMVMIENSGTILDATIDRAGEDPFIGPICAKKGQPVN